MNDLDAFLASTLPRMRAAETALHNGDASQRIAMWSRIDPVTLFGAAFTGSGWAEVRPIFDLLGSRFSSCTSSDFELIGAGVGGDLAYIVGIEHITASVAGALPTPYSLRSTTIFRREDGEWKVVHRHGDPYDPSTGQLASRMRESGTPCRAERNPDGLPPGSRGVPSGTRSGGSPQRASARRQRPP